MNDQAFCEAMSAVGDQSEHLLSYNVIHGECSLMKLTDAFMFGKQNFYSFIKFSDFDEVAQSLAISSQKTNLLRLTGPSGMGKSFLMQYLVRKLRAMPHVCVLYLANPELFVKPGKINLELVLMELLYSLSHCLDDEMIEWFKVSLAKMNRKYDAIEQWELLKQTFLKVIEFLRLQKKILILVLDQEEVYNRNNQDNIDSVAAKLYEFLLHGCFGNANVISSHSHTSKLIEDTANTKRLVKMLSDVEILAVFKSRCCPVEGCLMSRGDNVSDEFARSATHLVSNSIGRCPRDIHILLNAKVPVKSSASDSEVVLVRSEPDIADVPSAASPETASGSQKGFEEAKPSSSNAGSYVTRLELRELMFPTIDEKCLFFYSGRLDVVKRHENFFGSLSRQEQDAFLLMLTIADKSPPIGKDGLYVYDVLPTKCLEATSKLNNRGSPAGLYSYEQCVRDIQMLMAEIRMMESEQGHPNNTIAAGSNTSIASTLHHALSFAKTKEANRGLVNISSFLRVPGFEEYESVWRAYSILDERYFFIDERKCIRPVSELAFRAIKKYHYSKHGSRFHALLDKVGDKNQFSDLIFQFLFFNEFSNPNSAHILKLGTASSSRYVFTELSIPIRSTVKASWDFKRVFDNGNNFMVKLPTGFPLIDFCIICPNDTLSDAQEFNMLKNFPWIDDGSKVNFQFRKKATLFLGHIGVKCMDNETGALKIALDAGKAPNRKRFKVNSETGPEALHAQEEDSLKGNQELKNLVRSFVKTSIDLYCQPYVHFLWITKTADALDTCHFQIIVCCDSSVVKNTTSEVQQMDITSKISPKSQ